MYLASCADGASFSDRHRDNEGVALFAMYAGTPLSRSKTNSDRTKAGVGAARLPATRDLTMSCKKDPRRASSIRPAGGYAARSIEAGLHDRWLGGRSAKPGGSNGGESAGSLGKSGCITADILQVPRAAKRPKGGSPYSCTLARRAQRGLQRISDPQFRIRAPQDRACQGKARIARTASMAASDHTGAALVVRSQFCLRGSAH